MGKHLGSGTFGDVYKDRDKAVKNFHELHHCIQEYCAASYLNDCEHVVKCTDVDFRNNKISYELHKTNMRQWLDNPKRTKREKILLLRDVIYGLIEIHTRNLVHSDVKPNNILVSFTSDGYKATLCDLGFVANPPYSKVRRTAATYRDTNPVSHYGHDIYSLCIMMMEIFYNVRVRQQLSYEEFSDLIDKYVTDKRIKSFMLRMIHRDHDKRPTSSEVLKYMYDETYYPVIPKYSTFHINIKNSSISDKYSNIIEWTEEVCKSFDIKRCDIACEMVIYFIQKYKITKSFYQLTVVVVLVILSSILGKSGFTMKVALKACKHKYTKEEFIVGMEYMTSDRDILHKIFSL